MKRIQASCALMMIFTGLLGANLDQAQAKKNSLPHNSTDECPQPRVGNCSCKNGHDGKVRKVFCSGLDAMPSHLPLAVTGLEIAHGSIQQVSRDYFLNHNSIYTLKIYGNHLSTKFQLPKNAMVLDLRWNKLNGSTLHGMFDGLTRMKQLDISHNTVDNIIPGTFKSLKNLNILNMGACNIKNIHEGTFDGLHVLSKLSLSYNPLKIVRRNMFKGINSSMGLSLFLRACELQVIEDGTFQNMSFLKYLKLSINHLTQFPDLKGIAKSINILDLSENQITDISPITQSGIEEILWLDLSDNRIESIPEGFKKLKILQQLSFSNNRIKKITKGVLNGFNNLQQLSLQNNEIEVIEKGSFDGMTGLDGVFLFKNKLTSLPDDLFVGTSLQNLFLNDNDFVNLTGRPFRGVKKTKTLLYLFSNRIRYIEPKVLEDLGNEAMTALRCRSLVNLPLISKSSMGKIKCTPYNLPPIAFYDGADYAGVARALSRSGFECKNPTAHYWECYICKAGTYGDGQKHSQCVGCPAGGFYQEEMGQNTCKNCSIGTFVHPDLAPGTSPLSCEACPRGTQSNKHAGYRACSCLGNFYRFDRFRRCWACPSKGFLCRSDHAILAKGYYWKWTNLTSKRQYSDFIDNLKVESDEFVKSAWRYSGTLPKPHKCLRKSSCLGGLNSNCADGYEGPLCALCRTNYFKRMNRCIRCPSKFVAGVEIAVVIVVFVGILFVLFKTDKKRVQNDRRTIADIILSCFKIIIGFYQVMAGLYACFSNIEWPSSVIWMQKALRFVELNVLEFAPLSCLSPKFSFNALQQFVFVLVSNAAVVLAILIYLAVRILQHKNKKGATRGDIAESIAHTKSSCIRNICVFLFATYPKTCTSIIQVFSANCIPLCAHDDSSAQCTHFLRSDVSVQCQTPLYEVYSKVALGFLVYPVGFLIVILLLVWYYVRRPARKMSRDNPDNELLRVPEDNRRHMALVFDEEIQSSPLKSGLSVFYENYRPECWYWETVEMARKLVLTSVLTLIGEHSRTQIGLGAIISAVFAVLYVYLHPINDPFENKLQTFALIAVFINLGIGVILKESDDNIPVTVNHRNDKEGVSILLVIVNCAVITIVIVSCLKMVVKRLYKWCKTDRCCVGLECCQALLGCCDKQIDRVNHLQNNNYDRVV